MLVLRSIEVQGLGPFADKQVIEFPQAGVVVVYGENMRGKTTLLNAIRYAFFGTVVGRGSRKRKLHELSNRDLASQGRFGFSVVLRFAHHGIEYELERECRPRAGVATPVRDDDYQQEVYLLRGDQPLGPDERQRVLSQVFPDQISRFFLFDGELLQEYEELLFDQSEAGRRISQAIERILGLPILKRGRAHLTQLREEADKASAHEASRSKETEATGNSLRNAVEMKAAQQQELARLHRDLGALQAKRGEAEEYLRSHARYEAIVREHDACEEELAEVTQSLDEAQSSLQAAMKDAWRTLVAPRVRDARTVAHSRAAEQARSVIGELRRQALDTGRCGTCERDVDTATRQRLEARLAASPSTSGYDVESEMARLADLNSFRDSDISASVAELSRLQREQTVRRTTLRDKLKELTAELEEADVDRLQASAASLGDIGKKIGIVEAAIDKTEQKLLDLDNNIDRLSAKLEGLGTPDLRTTRLRSSLLRGASEVFTAAVEHYKDQLRERVEESATELFLSMTTEKEDYAGLSINDNYGLEIQHREGGHEIGRSAGAEHIVAMALMGALQKNAPLRGPIVMDSPFGRLDPGHTSNVVDTLPRMAPQVALLVHGKEVTREQLRMLLGSHLKREYELVRVSARQTRIARVD